MIPMLQKRLEVFDHRNAFISAINSNEDTFFMLIHKFVINLRGKYVIRL